MITVGAHAIPVETPTSLPTLTAQHGLPAYIRVQAAASISHPAHRHRTR